MVADILIFLISFTLSLNTSAETLISIPKNPIEKNLFQNRNKFIYHNYSELKSINSNNIAQSSATLSKSCKNAIENVQKEFKKNNFFMPFVFGKIVNPETLLNSSFISDFFYDYPLDRSQSVRFILIDDQIFNSPKLMTILASQIIDKCRTVGLVEFAHLFEDTRLVGLLKNGTVKIFDGIKPNTQHTKTFILPNGLLRTRFQWGYFIYKDTGINTGIK